MNGRTEKHNVEQLKLIGIFSHYGFEINFSVVRRNKSTTKKLNYKNTSFDFKILEFLAESMMNSAANFCKENISDIKTFKVESTYRYTIKNEKKHFISIFSMESQMISPLRKNGKTK